MGGAEIPLPAMARSLAVSNWLCHAGMGSGSVLACGRTATGSDRLADDHLIGAAPNNAWPCALKLHSPGT
jgi:hypothetical protein